MTDWRNIGTALLVVAAIGATGWMITETDFSLPEPREYRTEQADPADVNWEARERLRINGRIGEAGACLVLNRQNPCECRNKVLLAAVLVEENGGPGAFEAGESIISMEHLLRAGC